MHHNELKQNTQVSLSSIDDEAQLPSLSNQENHSQNNQKIKKKSNSTLIVNLADTRYIIVKKVVKDKLGFKIAKDPNFADWDLLWTDNAVHPETLAKMKPFQKINHFPGMFSLSRKNYLARNLIKMNRQFPLDYDFYPKTWVLPSQYNDLKQSLQTEQGSVVIAKPEASCQGRGIFLSKNIQDFDFGEHYVVQKYLKKPFLIDGLKFDLRVYVLIAGCDPLRLYVYQEGLARFATEPYCIPKKQNLNNLFMHLTNYAINKGNSKFEYNDSTTKMDTGHKRSLTSILTKLDDLGHNSKQIWEQICQLITKTMISAQPTLAHHYRSCQPDNFQNNMCFQILGFDVILQSNLKPVILQVNYTPSFTTDTPLDTLIKQNLIRDTLVLMNISKKTKNDTLNHKKRQIMQRTLTGKKIWHSREQREHLINKSQAKRDQWQNSHLGNFIKVYPLDNKAINMKYLDFLSYSETCYLSVTGGNIKRNAKVSLPSHATSQINQIEKIKTHPIKFTNTDQLQKIYIKKPKLMINYSRKPIRNQSVGRREEDGKNTNQQLCQQINSRQFQRSKVYNSIQKINMAKIQNRSGTGCATQKGNYSVQKRPESAKNGRGLSKIYNIAFKQMKAGQ